MERRAAWTLATVITGSMVVFLDATIVNVALETIGEQLPATTIGVLEGQAYVVNAYLLALAALLILAGGLADRYGRRRMFLLGLGGFAVSSALCGLAPTMETLVAFRLLQGAFGAFLVPTSLAIISSTFVGAAAGRAYGIWAAVSSLAFVVGPALGGLLVDTVGWSAAFWINVPIAAIAGGLGVRFLAESRDAEPRAGFDWLGSAVVAAAVGGLAFGAIRGQQSGWTDSAAWWSLAVGSACAMAAVPLMRLRSDPLIPLHLFASRSFSVINISTLLIYGTFAVYATTQAVFLQGTLGYTALASGLTAFPSGLLLAVFSTTVGERAGRIGPRPFLVVGPLLIAIGFAWLVRLPESSPAWIADVGRPGSLVPPPGVVVDILPAVLCFGVGLALMVAPLTQALMGSVAPRHAALGSAINNAVARVGPLLAGAVVFVAVTAVFYGALGARLPGTDVSDPSLRAAIPPLNAPTVQLTVAQAAAVRSSSTDAYHVAMLIAALTCAAGAAVNGVGLQRQPLPGE